MAPHVALTLPTDTSRLDPGRHPPPLRQLLGGTIVDHPFALVDVGGTQAGRWSVLGYSESLAMIVGAVGGDGSELFVSSTTALAFVMSGTSIDLGVDFSFLGRLTHAPGAEVGAVFGVGEMIRFRHRAQVYGIGLRIDITDQGELAMLAGFSFGLGWGRGH